jgi:hypothetical protein
LVAIEGGQSFTVISQSKRFSGSNEAGVHQGWAIGEPPWCLRNERGLSQCASIIPMRLDVVLSKE